MLPRPTHSHVPLSLRDCCYEVPKHPCSKDHTGPGDVENRATAESDTSGPSKAVSNLLQTETAGRRPLKGAR